MKASVKNDGSYCGGALINFDTSSEDTRTGSPDRDFSLTVGICKVCNDLQEVTNPSWPGTPYCKQIGPEHVHLVIICEDGSGTVPVPITSRPFLAAIIGNLQTNLNVYDEAIMHEVLAESAKKLAPTLSDLEHEILADPKKFETLTRFSFASI